MEISEQIAYVFGGIMGIGMIWLTTRKIGAAIKADIMLITGQQTDAKLLPITTQMTQGFTEAKEKIEDEVEEAKKDLDDRCNQRFSDFSGGLTDAISDMTVTMNTVNSNINQHMIDSAKSTGEINTNIKECTTEIGNVKRHLASVDLRGKEDGKKLAEVAEDVARMSGQNEH